MKANETLGKDELTITEATAQWGEELITQLKNEILDVDNYGIDGDIEWRGGVDIDGSKYIIAYRYSTEDIKNIADKYGIEIDEVNSDMLPFDDDEAIFWEV